VVGSSLADEQHHPADHADGDAVDGAAGERRHFYERLLPVLSGSDAANIKYSELYGIGLTDGGECGHRELGQFDDHRDGERRIQFCDLVIGLRSAQWGDGKLQSDVDFRWCGEFDDDHGGGFIGGHGELSDHGDRQWWRDHAHCHRQPHR